MGFLDGIQEHTRNHQIAQVALLGDITRRYSLCVTRADLDALWTETEIRRGVGERVDSSYRTLSSSISCFIAVIRSLVWSVMLCAW